MPVRATLPRRASTRALWALAFSGAVLVTPTQPADAGLVETFPVVVAGGRYQPTQRVDGQETLTIQQGARLLFANADVGDHSITSTGMNSQGEPLFDSGVIGTGAYQQVTNTRTIDLGSYPIYCRVVPNMRGVLRVLPSLPGLEAVPQVEVPPLPPLPPVPDHVYVPSVCLVYGPTIVWPCMRRVP